MRFDVREPKRKVTNAEFNRWFNSGRKIKQRPDKACALRSKYTTLRHVLHKAALYGQHRGGV